MHHLTTFAWCCATVVNHLRLAWSIITLTLRPRNIGAKLSDPQFYRKEFLVYSYPTWFSWWKCSRCKSYMANSKHVVTLLSQRSSTLKLARVHMSLRLGVSIRIKQHHIWTSNGLHQVSKLSSCFLCPLKWYTFLRRFRKAFVRVETKEMKSLKYLHSPRKRWLQNCLLVWAWIRLILLLCWWVFHLLGWFHVSVFQFLLA